MEIICLTPIKTMPEKCEWCYLFKSENKNDTRYKMPARCYGANRRFTDDETISAIVERMPWCPLYCVDSNETKETEFHGNG